MLVMPLSNLPIDIHAAPTTPSFTICTIENGRLKAAKHFRTSADTSTKSSTVSNTT
jgi:hypothetical protein